MKESTVFEHLLQCKCAIDFDHFDILVSDTNSFRHLIKENLLIKRDKPFMNHTFKSFPLTNLYFTHSVYFIIRKIYVTIELYDG